MTFQSRLISKYKKQGYIVLKIIRANENGFPDLELMKDSKSIFIEVKQGKDTLKALQKYQIDRLIAKGFLAFCLHEDKGIIYPVKININDYQDFL